MKGKFDGSDVVWHPCQNECGAEYRDPKAAEICCHQDKINAEIARRYDIPRIQGERPL